MELENGVRPCAGPMTLIFILSITECPLEMWASHGTIICMLKITRLWLSALGDGVMILWTSVQTHCPFLTMECRAQRSRERGRNKGLGRELFFREIIFISVILFYFTGMWSRSSSIILLWQVKSAPCQWNPAGLSQAESAANHTLGLI